MTDERTFTLDEANALLPALAESLVKIRESRQVVLAGAERIRGTHGSNGGGAFAQEYLDALGTLRREVEAVTSEGVILRDPESGLIDFPSRQDDRDVLLCWRLGEDRVSFWHGPDSGFVGRQPL
jgi:hypothetical protein